MIDDDEMMMTMSLPLRKYVYCGIWQNSLIGNLVPGGSAGEVIWRHTGVDSKGSMALISSLPFASLKPS